jgi:hypothetical protein
MAAVAAVAARDDDGLSTEVRSSVDALGSPSHAFQWPQALAVMVDEYNGLNVAGADPYFEHRALKPLYLVVCSSTSLVEWGFVQTLICVVLTVLRTVYTLGAVRSRRGWRRRS